MSKEAKRKVNRLKTLFFIAFDISIPLYIYLDVLGIL